MPLIFAMPLLPCHAISPDAMPPLIDFHLRFFFFFSPYVAVTPFSEAFAAIR